MHEGVALMVENFETPCTTCIDIDDVNKGIKKMASGKAANATYVSIELLKMDNATYSLLDNANHRASYKTRISK